MTTNLRAWWRLPPFDEHTIRPRAWYRPEHVGLYLDRCLPLPYERQRGDAYKPKTQNDLVNQKAHRVTTYESAIKALTLNPDAKAAQTYRACYKRWHNALSQGAPQRAVREILLTTTTRMLLHPSANQSITDGAVLMHHTYGAPYLPGSGLKGLARAQARREGLPAELITALFGNERHDGGAAEDTDQAALVRFLDALWIPEAPKEAPEDKPAAEWSPLSLDVITPHHGAYYTGVQPPGDWQQPVPTQRLTVAPGAQFCVILEGCQGSEGDLRPWLERAAELLVMAAAELGFGAYTRAGFGRMRDGDGKAAEIAEARRKEEAAAEKIWADAEEAARKAKAEAEEATRWAQLPWQPVFVSRDPGSGRLTLQLTTQGNKRVFVSGDLVRALFACSPAGLEERLIKRKSLECQAQLDTQNGTLRVVGLK